MSALNEFMTNFNTTNKGAMATKIRLNGLDKLNESLKPLFTEDERELVKIIQDNNSVKVSTLNATMLYAATRLINRKSIYEYVGGFSGDKYYGVREFVTNSTGAGSV